jgi:thioredoxin-related protein
MKRLMVVVMGLLTAVLLAYGACAAGLPVAADLRGDGQQARAENLPILLFFSAKSCQYCEQMRSLYLEPMYAGGNYAGKLIMREVQIESGHSLRDFQGKQVSHADFAHRNGISLTPQILFMDPAGKELVPALVGLSTPDFFSGYLEEAIDAALARMRATRP